VTKYFFGTREKTLQERLRITLQKVGIRVWNWHFYISDTLGVVTAVQSISNNRNNISQFALAAVTSKTSRFLCASQNFEKRLLASSCLSVRPNFRLSLDGFSWNLLGIFPRSAEKIQVSLTFWRRNFFKILAYPVYKM